MKIGVAKVDFTPEVMGITMLGYGVPTHKVEDIITRLHARAFYMEDKSGTALCMVVAELGFITNSIRHGVLRKLSVSELAKKIDDSNLFLMAQHTHNAPGGYSYHPLYNVSTPGFQPRVLEAYTDGIYNAIVDAYKNVSKGKVKYGKHYVPEDRKVSFNRALAPYNANEDTELIKFTHRHLAVDREMRMLTFFNNEKPIGLLNWFAVHTTSIPSTVKGIHFDNKGYASKFMEDRLDNAVAAFAHGYSGDVSPNYVFDPKKKQERLYNGASDNHDENAQFNGNIQYEEACEILKINGGQKPLIDHFDAHIMWVDMSNISIDQKYAQGRTSCHTSKSCWGVEMFAGSQSDGIGMPDYVVPVAKSFCQTIKNYELNILSKVAGKKVHQAIQKKYAAQGPKDILMETGVNRLLGSRDIKNIVLPGFLDETIKLMKHFHKKGAFDLLPMTTQELPFQIISLGQLLMVTYPFELTTTSGNRLKEFIKSRIVDTNFSEVLVVPYANGFNGYITTPEEYALQEYEGGHCVFGQWSLYALMQITDQLLVEFNKTPELRNRGLDVLSRYDNLDIEPLMY